MLNMVDTAYAAYPQVTPCVFVDDIAADTGDDEEDSVVTRLSRFLQSTCCRLTADGMEVSASKSVVTATKSSTGEAIAGKLNHLGIRYTKK